MRPAPRLAGASEDAEMWVREAVRVIIPVVSCILGSTALAATSPMPTLMSSHSIELGIGFLGGIDSESSVSSAGVSTNTGANGFLGSVGYLYGLDRNAQLSASAGVLSLETSTTTSAAGAMTNSGTVAHLLFGGRYSLPALDEREIVRAYIGVAFGPYVGSASRVQAGTITATESITETTFGSRVAVGLNARTGRHFSIGLGVGYHFVGDFERVIGGKRNYSGPEAGLRIAFMFGGG
jgi:hypothetical protein